MFLTYFSLHLNELNTKFHGFGKPVDVIFDNIKAFEIKLKILKRDVDNGTFKYFPNLQNTRLILKLMKKQTFRAFKCNFQALLIQLSNNSLQDLLSSGHLKKLQNS
jgi:hypothetical protein